jgi:hypothetical protein
MGVTLAGNPGQQVNLHPRDARYPVLQHNLQHRGPAERWIRWAQELGVAPGLWDDQKERAVRAKNPVQPLDVWCDKAQCEHVAGALAIT